MNEREFLKKLNSKDNEDGSLTAEIVEELLAQGKSLTVIVRENIFTRLFRRIKKQKNAKQIIEDNMEYILEKTANGKLDDLLELFMQEKEIVNVVRNKFDAIMDRLQKEQTDEEDYSWQWVDYARKRFLKAFRKTKNADDILRENIDKILKEKITFEDAKNLKGLSEEADEKLNQKLEKKKDEIAKEILKSSVAITAIKPYLIDDYATTVRTMIEELLKSEGTRWIDIEQIGRPGGYSKVYQIGDKVFKIGRTRESYQIPNHPRILQPLIRINLLDERDNNKEFACVEISDMVDELEEEDLRVESLYKLYKELRDDGIIWTDARFPNVGALRKPNTPNLYGENRRSDPRAIGMDKEMQEKVLEAGEWVILDTDLIYREEDGQSIIWIENSYSERFEKRWQQERQGKIIEDYQNEKTEKSGERTKSYERRKWSKGPEEER